MMLGSTILPMAKTILSVGFEVPGGEVEDVEALSNRSLLDADIIIFQPGIPYTYGGDSYLGKDCLSDDGSFRVREALVHWRRELAAAVDAGKLVVLLLDSPEVVYAATGRKEYSGTGKNARTTRIVEQLEAYSAVPTKWTYHAATGTEMLPVSEARFFASYWADFAQYSQYRLYLDAEAAKPLVRTKTGNRLVGAYVLKGRGALLAVPALDLEEEAFVETRKVNGKDEHFWTEAARVFGKKFAGALVALADAIASESAVTPQPDWSRDDAYRISTEVSIEATINEITEQVLRIEERRRDLEAKLAAAGDLRRLLFEQGKTLETVVLQALRLLGFEATGFKENGSEFDAVFVSAEGRFIGEVEGKDNKAINIDKFSQLERNLNEDFAREEVSDYAKGVLFGNAFRLKPPKQREAPFTEKCQTAALRLGVALVHTPDLFHPCRYLQETSNADYAKACRQAIFTTVGSIVVFPVHGLVIFFRERGTRSNRRRRNAHAPESLRPVTHL